MTAVDSSEIYRMIKDRNLNIDEVITKYRNYIVAWKYQYYETEIKYIPNSDKLMSFNNFIAMSKYQENFPIKDTMSDYVLGNISLDYLKKKIDKITNSIKKQR